MKAIGLGPEGREPFSHSLVSRRCQYLTHPVSRDAEERRRLERMAGNCEGKAVLEAVAGQPTQAPRPPQALHAKTYFDQHGGTYTQPHWGAIPGQKDRAIAREAGRFFSSLKRARRLGQLTGCLCDTRVSGPGIGRDCPIPVDCVTRECAARAGSGRCNRLADLHFAHQ